MKLNGYHDDYYSIAVMKGAIYLVVESEGFADDDDDVGLSILTQFSFRADYWIVLFSVGDSFVLVLGSFSC